MFRYALVTVSEDKEAIQEIFTSTIANLDQHPYSNDCPVVVGSNQTIRDLTVIDPNKTLRPDFDYDCECGFYVCDTCGFSMYPMEVITQDDGTPDICPECGFGDMIQSVYKD